MLRRTRRGEKAFTVKTGARSLGLLGLVEYVVLMPYGATWYGAGTTLTAVAIVPFTPRALR